MEFCDLLIRRNLSIKFVIETHLRILDTELIDVLKKAGLKAVKVGVESFDDNVRKESGRFSVSNDQQLEKIRELEKNNVQVSAMYILGFPTDTDDTINKTINYSKKLNTTYAQFSVWTPYPGTPIFNEYKDKITVVLVSPSRGEEEFPACHDPGQRESQKRRPKHKVFWEKTPKPFRKLSLPPLPPSPQDSLLSPSQLIA